MSSNRRRNTNSGRTTNSDRLKDNSTPSTETTLKTPGRTPASGSSLEGNPVPRCGVFRVRSQDRPPSSGKWKTSDKENLPYFRIWKSLTYSNRLRPALGRLYKGNPNPKTRDRHFKTSRLGLDG
ncbi:hypothetical protein DY000_02020701 [Brassica cretica]|uniref:Uncharacterized protein n=1 Tax=Brassica cretica TaxID=69181 RepID=A0ABQ7ENL0_BRACR|nr:hypothetical protein DY000_02020701 [Brassica cretica]